MIPKEKTSVQFKSSVARFTDGSKRSWLLWVSRYRMAESYGIYVCRWSMEDRMQLWTRSSCNSEFDDKAATSSACLK
jgi:hypothetical protein